MKEEDKTKQQLMGELAELRQRVAELEAVETERRHADEALRNSERKYRHLFNELNDAVFLADVETGRILDTNRQAEVLLGRTREEIIGMHQSELHPPQMTNDYRQRFADHVRKGHSADYDGEVITKDGTIVPVNIGATPVTIGGKNLMFGLFRDITERERADEALRESRRRYIDLINFLPQTIFEMDREGNLTFANRQGALTFGYTLDDVRKGLTREQMYVPEDRERIKQNTQRVLSGEDVGAVEYTALRKDGSTFPVLAYTAPITRGNEIVGLRGITIDITKQKQAEQIFQTIALSSPAGIYIAQDGKFVFANPRLLGDRNMTEDGLLGSEFTDAIHPEDREMARQNAVEMLKGVRTAPYEYRILDQDGTVVWASETVASIQYQGRRAALGVVLEITERKRAEELYQTLASSSAVGIYIVQDGRCQFGNPRFQKYTGYTEDELLGMGSLNLVHPEDRKMVRQNAVEMLRGNRLAPYEFRYIRKSGEAIWAMETVASIQYRGRQATLGSFMDITDRKQAEEELRESEARYHALLNLGGTIGEAIVMLQDTELGAAIHTFVSDEWPRITGYSRKELLRMSFFDLLHSRYRAASLKRHRKKMKGEIIPGLFEMAIVRKDGAEVPIEVTSAYTTYQGERANVVFIRDITERKEAEERQKQLQEELLLSSRLASVGELAAGVAHEINNPLTGVLGLSQRLLRKSTDLENSQYLGRIYNEAKRAARVIENLLTFARRREPEKEYTSINDILGRTLELRAYELRTGSIDLEVELAPGLPRTMVDSQQIEHVFLNLILNAEQAMSEANGSGELSVKTQQMKQGIRISFADNGPGISKEDLGRVFDPFFTTRGTRGGTGLGLSLCHGIVTEHGGKIYARSKPGEGSTFFVELPVVAKKS